MLDAQQAGSLLSRMTSETSTEIKFTDDQADKIVEVVIPRMVTQMPGMPHMTCTVERDKKGWTIRVEKP